MEDWETVSLSVLAETVKEQGFIEIKGSRREARVRDTHTSGLINPPTGSGRSRTSVVLMAAAT
jgi:hypothetical protein